MQSRIPSANPIRVGGEPGFERSKPAGEESGYASKAAPAFRGLDPDDITRAPPRRTGYTGAMKSFRPDSRLVHHVRPSPNHYQRAPGLATDILLLHYTGMKTTAVALERLCDPVAKVSSHYVIDEDGRITALVPEARRAWHAGVSSWEGETDINSRSIGIEIGNVGHDLGYPDFPDAQIDGVIALCRDIIHRHRIRADRVLAHSDVAPDRKVDPGEKFPWERLHRAGIGLWVAAAPPSAPALGPDDKGEAVSDLQDALRRYGYGIEPTGIYDEVTAAVVTAFQLHFRPARVDGRADRSTIEALRQLLAARDGGLVQQSEAITRVDLPS
jgi:N-acetylmuramoyl-L-alanine amidase